MTLKFKVILNTYNPDVIETLKGLGNKKSQFVEMAVLHFLQTKKGKETLKFILEGKNRTTRKNAKVDSPMPGKEIQSQKEDQGCDKKMVNIDDFFK